MYLILAKPFEEPRLNKIEIFNEMCILGNSYLLFVFTDFVDSQRMKDIAGYFMILFTMGNFLINLLIIIKISLPQIRRSYK